MEFYEKIPDKPDLTDETTIRTVLLGDGAKVYRAGPVDLEIGGHVFKHFRTRGNDAGRHDFGHGFFAPTRHQF